MGKLDKIDAKLSFGKPRKCEFEFEKRSLGKFKMLGYNETTKVYLYERKIPYEGCEHLVYYEVFKARKSAECDYDIYPSSSQFGDKAKCCSTLERALFYYNNGF